MANANSTARAEIKTSLDAMEALRQASNITSFLQEVLTLSPDGEIPENLNTSGLYHILQDVQDRINDARIVLEQPATAKVEA